MSVHRPSKTIPRVTLVLSILLLAAAAQEAPEPGANVDIRQYGALGDGITDATTAFHQALEDIGDSAAVIAIRGGSFAVNSIRFPENVTLRFTGGGQLQITPEQTLEIRGTIDAGIEHIFAGDGVVRGTIRNRQVYPQWFGARGDGVHDDAPALQKAADLAVGSMGRTLFIPDGEYALQDSVRFRCNIESRGLLVRNIAIDEARTVTPPGSPLPSHYAVHDARIQFVPDADAVELSMEPFWGILEGDLKVPVATDVPLASGEGTVGLAEGGVLRFYSTDFFSSRRNSKGDQFYDRNDIMQVVTGLGDVFPEFAFSYARPPEAEQWNPEAFYDKGAYVAQGGEIFKATWPSGPGSGYTHRHLGAVEFGAVEPDPEATTTHYRYEYENGVRDSITIWRRLHTQVWYRPKDVPLTVNGLRVEVRLAENTGEFKRIRSGAVSINRSNMTFNRLDVRARDREAMMSSLVGVAHCVNVTFNNAYVSGATYHGLGYNLLNSNAADIRYNNCVSTNSRKGIDGRHGKNITVEGGFYNVIEDHYGRNMTIRNVVVSGLSTYIPGYQTPDVKLEEWGFSPRRPFGFSGANLHIENCVVDRAERGILGVRGDIGDLYGAVVLKNISVRRNPGDVSVFSHGIGADFDYAHEVRSPGNLVIEDIMLEVPGKLLFTFGAGFTEGTYGPVQVRHCGPIGQVHTASASTSFVDCGFDSPRFAVAPGGMVNFKNCVFSGTVSGLNEDAVGIAVGNAATKGAGLLFPLEYHNPARYADREEILEQARVMREIFDRWDLLPDVPEGVYSPVLELQGGTRVIEDGPAGAALEIPFVDEQRQQGAVIRQHPVLFPDDAFSLEVMFMPGERFYEKLADSRWHQRAVLLDTMAVDYVHDNPTTECKHGYMMDLRWVDENSARVAASVGFGRDEELGAFVTDPVNLVAGQWYHILFTYDGNGTGKIYLDGTLATEATYEGKGGMVPSKRRDLHIGERATSTYRSFPGKIGLVRLHHKVADPTP